MKISNDIDRDVVKGAVKSAEMNVDDLGIFEGAEADVGRGVEKIIDGLEIFNSAV